MKYILMLMLSLSPLMYSYSKTVDNSVSTNELTEICYDPNTNTWYYDLWDCFMQGVQAGTITFTWTKAAICYLISNVKVLDSRPEVRELDLLDRIEVVVIVFRWSW